MTMSVTRKLLTAAAAVLLISGAACASKPKPGPDGMGPGGSTTGADNGVNGGDMAAIPGSEQDFVVNVGDRVYFDYDQYTIRADAQPILDAQARWLNQYRSVTVRIEGNADERGTREYNFALGGRRAESVRDYLVNRGISPSRIETISYGKERPIDPGSNEQAWARNRNGHTAITGGAR
jgi:peptidoglycan-associated lipoprotein